VTEGRLRDAANYEQWNALIGEISVGDRLPIHFKRDLGVLKMSMEGPCTSTGEYVTLYFSVQLCPWISRPWGLRFLYKAALDFYTHELGE
jgi:hypothetical protein